MFRQAGLTAEIFGIASGAAGSTAGIFGAQTSAAGSSADSYFLHFFDQFLRCCLVFVLVIFVKFLSFRNVTLYDIITANSKQIR